LAAAGVLKHLQPEQLLLIEVVELVLHRLCEGGGAAGAEGWRRLVPVPVAAHVDIDLGCPLLEAAQPHHTHLEPVAYRCVRLVAVVRRRPWRHACGPLRALAAGDRGGGGGRCTRRTKGYTKGHLKGLGPVAKQPPLDSVELSVDGLEARARHKAAGRDRLLHAVQLRHRHQLVQPGEHQQLLARAPGQG